MNLETQIKLIIFSFTFGAFLGLMIDINHRFLYTPKKNYRIVFTFCFVIVNAFLYFLILQKINNGIIHIYSLFCIILGFFSELFIRKRVVKQKK